MVGFVFVVVSVVLIVGLNGVVIICGDNCWGVVVGKSVELIWDEFCCFLGLKLVVVMVIVLLWVLSKLIVWLVNGLLGSMVVLWVELIFRMWLMMLVGLMVVIVFSFGLLICCKVFRLVWVKGSGVMYVWWISVCN